MKIPLLILFCVCSSFAYPQTPEGRVLHFSADGQLADRETADYYTVDSTWSDKTSSSYSFYLNPERPRSIERRASDDKPKGREMYHKSGNLYMKGLFYQFLPVGLITLNYENGMPMGEVEFPNDHKTVDDIKQYKIIQYTDSLGNKIVVEGNGFGYIDFKKFRLPSSIEETIITPGTGAVVAGRKDGTWKGLTSDGTYEEIYEKGEIVSGTQTVNGRSYAYTRIEVMPEYSDGGLAGLAKYIGSNVVYPRVARRRGTEGTVYTEFVVNSDGRIIDIKVIKGISVECDAEATRVVSLMPAWSPGTLRGKTVKVCFVLPVKFKLG